MLKYKKYLRFVTNARLSSLWLVSGRKPTERSYGMPYTNEDIIDALYRLYEQSMYFEAYKILHDEYLAEDAVHEAFLSLIMSSLTMRCFSSFSSNKLN